MRTADDRARGAAKRRVAALVLSSLLVPAAALARCDTQALLVRAQQSLPGFAVRDVRASSGIVTVLLSRRGGVVQFAAAMRTEGPAFFTSVIGAQFDADEPAEAAQIAAVVAGWYGDAAMLRAVDECSQEGVPPGDTTQAVRDAATNALAPLRLGEHREAQIVVGALLSSLLIIAWPALRRRSDGAPRPRTDWREMIAALAVGLAAMAIALAVAWRLVPEVDEVFTLANRHETLSYLVSWKVGGEPFNTPGSPVLYSLWLRLAPGFLWARVLPILLIPLTALVAYRAGEAAFGRAAGLCFAALLVLAPEYLRITAIARAYALVVLALCAILAAVAETSRGERRGVAVGLSSLLGMWASFLLWPLALAAPWMARLTLRDRLRVTAGLAVMAAAIAPRIPNGLAEGRTRTGTFELATITDALSYAVARAGHAAPYDYRASAAIAWLAGAVVVVLIAVAITARRRRAPRQLRNGLLALVLVVLPVLALLRGGLGIRERHVITVQVVLALCAAAGLATLLQRTGGRAVRMAGWIAVVGVAVISLRGNAAMLVQPSGWLSDVDHLLDGADVLLIVPRRAQFPVLAMLTGNSPVHSDPARWPPVCQSDGDWWCRRVRGVPSVSVDDVSDAVVDAASHSARSVWILEAGEKLPRRLGSCDRLSEDNTWTVLQCSGPALASLGPAG